MFKGSIVAIVTPMKSSGDIDYAGLERLVAWHLESNTRGIVLLGTTGESPTIEFDERDNLIKRVIAQVNEKIPVIVGTGTNSTHHTLELTQHAMKAGADAALIVTPYYNKPTQEGLFLHFSTIANKIPLPIVLYNVPSRTGCDLLPETVARLAKISNIVALKEANNLERIDQLLKLQPDLDILSGEDAMAMEYMLRGAKGVVSVTANVAPEMVNSLCEAALKQDRAAAENWNNQLAALNKKLFVEANPIPVKWALATMGKIESGIRLPLTLLSEQYHDTVYQALKDARLC